MTPERLAEIRAVLGESDDSVRGAFPVEDAAFDLLAEVDRLRAQVVALRDAARSVLGARWDPDAAVFAAVGSGRDGKEAREELHSAIEALGAAIDTATLTA